MSEILKFYLGEPSVCKHVLSDIWGYSFKRLEQGHDYIQLLFPLDEPSAHNPDAPVLTEEDIIVFRGSPELQAMVMVSVHTFMRFLFFTRESWLTEFDHNHLRITRVIKCLILFGMNSHALSVFQEVMTMLDTKGEDYLVSDKSIGFWERAIAPAIELSEEELFGKAAEILPEQAHKYAIQHGWAPQPTRRGNIDLMNHPDHPLRQLHIPTDMYSIDYAEAMYEVLRRVSDIENRPIKDVLKDMIR